MIRRDGIWRTDRLRSAARRAGLRPTGDDAGKCPTCRQPHKTVPVRVSSTMKARASAIYDLTRALPEPTDPTTRTTLGQLRYLAIQLAIDLKETEPHPHCRYCDEPDERRAARVRAELGRLPTYETEDDE